MKTRLSEIPHVNTSHNIPLLDTKVNVFKPPNGTAYISMVSRDQDEKMMWYSVFLNDKIGSMINERRAWLFAREWEEERKASIPEWDLIRGLMQKYPKAFSDIQNTRKIIQTLIPEFAEWNNSLLETKYKGDNYFYFWFWWPKAADAIGFWKIWATIMGALAVIVSVVTLLTH